MHDKNPNRDHEKAFEYFKGAMKLLKSEIGKQNLASKMYAICAETGTEERMRKFKQYLPEGTHFKEASDGGDTYSLGGSSSGDEDDM